MTSTFTDDPGVISRQAYCKSNKRLSDVEFDTHFIVGPSAKWITQNNYHNVGLQFPDELLQYSVTVCQMLCSITKKFCFILGDSSFAGCCVDEVAGQRLHIDAIIHYGRACLAPLSGNLPVLYVFCCLPSTSVPPSVFDSPNGMCGVATQARRYVGSLPVIITYDFRHERLAASLYSELLHTPDCNDSNAGVQFIWSYPNPPGSSITFLPSPSHDFPVGKVSALVRCGRRFHIPIGKTELPKPPWGMVYVGEVGDRECQSALLSLYRILLAFPEVEYSNAVVLNTTNGTLEPVDSVVRGLLKRRSYLIERAKDAHRVGILIGTLSVRHYRDIIVRLQRLLHRSGRQFVTLAVGRLTPAKLANLPELDVLVLIACPESSLLDPREDLLIPIVTPFEMECALADFEIDSENTVRIWTGEKLWTDFSDLLPGGKAYIPETSLVPATCGSPERSDVSLITGKLRRTQVTPSNSTASDDTSHQLVQRGPWTVAEKGSGCINRTWYGLDPQYGETPVSFIREGRSGVPTHYTVGVLDDMKQTDSQSGIISESLEW